jgi:hypothetical protein
MGLYVNPASARWISSTDGHLGGARALAQGRRGDVTGVGRSTQGHPGGNLCGTTDARS